MVIKAKSSLTNVILALIALVYSLSLDAANYNAVIHWYERAELNSLVSGIVASIPVKPGDQVKKGATLLALDAQPFLQAIKKAQAKVTGLKAVADEAQREYKRSKQLFDETLLSVHQLELARIASIKARSNYLTALADLALAKNDNKNAIIRAPFDAIVLSRLVSKGSAIVVQSESKPLITVARTDKLLARFYVNLAQSRTIKVGTVGKVLIDGEEFEAKVVYVALEPVNINTLQSDYQVDIQFQPKSMQSMRIGQKVTVILP